MKRSSHSSSHAAVKGFQTFKRSQRSWITDYTRDGATAGSVGGLTLGRRLGFGFHGSGAGHTPQRDQSRLFSAQLGEVRRTPHGAEAIGACGAQVDGAKAGVLGGGQRLHGLLLWLTMERSLHVTSDASTTVGRLLICLLHNT